MQPPLSNSQAGTPLTELILNESQRWSETGPLGPSLGQVQLESVPQPGSEIALGRSETIAHRGNWYTVLERRHRYQFHANRYRLTRITLYVQAAPQAEDKYWLGDRWIIGMRPVATMPAPRCCAALRPPQAPAKAVATTNTATLRVLKRAFYLLGCPPPGCPRP
jgi:hypothetical protein